MNRLVCWCCGTEMIVERSDGKVSLRAVEYVHSGTDGTAAHVATRRKKLLQELEEIESSLIEDRATTAILAIILGCLLMLTGLIFLVGNEGFLAILFVLGGLVILYFTADEKRGAQARDAHTHSTSTKEEKVRTKSAGQL